MGFLRQLLHPNAAGFALSFIIENYRPNFNLWFTFLLDEANKQMHAVSSPASSKIRDFEIVRSRATDPTSYSES